MKRIAIDHFLTWAFGQEFGHLTAEGGLAGGGLDSSWGMIEAYAALGTRVDVSHIADELRFAPDLSRVHGDAELAARALRAVLAGPLDFAVDRFDPVPDWASLSPDLPPELVAGSLAEFRRRARGTDWRRRALALVIRHAVLGRAPGHHCPPPGVRQAMGANGRPAWFARAKRVDALGREVEVEVDGWSPVSRRPLKGAYRKQEWVRSPVADMLDRLDHAVWRSVLLAMLAGFPQGELTAHRLLPPAEPEPAWLAMARGRVVV